MYLLTSLAPKIDKVRAFSSRECLLNRMQQVFKRELYVLNCAGRQCLQVSIGCVFLQICIA